MFPFAGCVFLSLFFKYFRLFEKLEIGASLSRWPDLPRGKHTFSTVLVPRWKLAPGIDILGACRKTCVLGYVRGLLRSVTVLYNGSRFRPVHRVWMPGHCIGKELSIICMLTWWIWSTRQFHWSSFWAQIFRWAFWDTPTGSPHIIGFLTSQTAFTHPIIFWLILGINFNLKNWYMCS